MLKWKAAAHLHAHTYITGFGIKLLRGAIKYYQPTITYKNNYYTMHATGIM